MGIRKRLRKKLGKLRRDLKEYQEIKEERSLAKSKTAYQVLLTQYADAYRKPVSDHTILYESFWGRGMVDNPYAIFLEISGRQEFADLKHIWVIDDFEDNQPIMDIYRERADVVFVQYRTKEYAEALATAKYLVNNTTFQNFFVKRPEQVYINTWHGTPIKAMGYDMPGGNSGVANTMRNFLCADHLLSANSQMTRMYLNSYKLQEIYPGEILQEGYPRNDLLIKTSAEDIRKKLEAYGIRLQEGRKIILYAPTWRESGPGQAVIDPSGLLEVKERLEAALDGGGYQILIKPHQYVYRQLKDLEEYKGLLVPATIDANELMSIVDIMLSDYSSIFLDYMVLERPILFYIPDLEEYKESRGLDLTPEELPGPASSRLEDIIDAVKDIENVRERYKERYDLIRGRMCPYEDGQASRRVVDIVLGAAAHKGIRAEKTKKSLLLNRGQFRVNGITHSFLNLLEQIDYDQFDVTVYVGEDKKDPAMMKLIDQMHPNVRTLVRTGTYVATVEEDARKEFVTDRGLYKRSMRRLYPMQIAQREFRRCFGDAEFDYIVDFEGYNTWFPIVLLQGKAKVKSIWQHNDIKKELSKNVNGKFTVRRGLNFNMSLYPSFDRIVSCGKSVMEVNRKNLATEETREKYVYAKNILDTKRIEENIAQQEIAYIEDRPYLIQNIEETSAGRMTAQMIPLPEEGTVNFVTMGRMSTEKNHETLIRAFALLQNEYPDTRLYIMGDGPLRDKEERLVFGLGLKDKVVLTGNVKNPFALMQRCQCFILPSLHEGQPMVLLEARVIHMPIIVSDFSTVADSLMPEGQLLIGSSRAEILEGMRSFMRGEVPVAYDFDVRTYNKEAYQEFIRAIT